MCCYDREAFSTNTIISSSMSEDGCAKVTIECEEETPGNAKMLLSVENYCTDYATKDQVEEIKEFLLEKNEAGSACQEKLMHEKDKSAGKQL